MSHDHGNGRHALAFFLTIVVSAAAGALAAHVPVWPVVRHELFGPFGAPWGCDAEPGARR